MNKKYLEYAKKFPAERFICKDPPPPTKLKRLSFENELKRAERGDHFVIYSPGVTGWVRYAVGRVNGQYIHVAGGGPVHMSHVHKLEKANGDSYER